MFSATLNLFRVKETRNKILFTLFGIFLFRVGSYLPVPGVDADVLKSQDASGYSVYLTHLQEEHYNSFLYSLWVSCHTLQHLS